MITYRNNVNVYRSTSKNLKETDSWTFRWPSPFDAMGEQLVCNNQYAQIQTTNVPTSLNFHFYDGSAFCQRGFLPWSLTENQVQPTPHVEILHRWRCWQFDGSLDSYNKYLTHPSCDITKWKLKWSIADMSGVELPGTHLTVLKNFKTSQQACCYYFIFNSFRLTKWLMPLATLSLFPWQMIWRAEFFISNSPALAANTSVGTCMKEKNHRYHFV